MVNQGIQVLQVWIWDSYNYTAHYYPLYIYIEYTSIGLSLFPLPQWLSILLHSNTYWYSMVIQEPMDVWAVPWE